MTTQPIYRLLCDAPHCPASVVVEKRPTTPEGWTRLDSCDHLEGKPPPTYGRGRSRRALSRFDLIAGNFDILLCPDHPVAFEAHYPRTSGGPLGRGEDARWVNVSCACGWIGRGTRDLLVVGKKPSSTVERMWLDHLPEELRWYATRSTNLTESESTHA